IMKKSIQRLILTAVFILVTAAFGALAMYVSKSQDPETLLKTKLLDKDEKVSKAFFSPDDHVKDILLELIHAEKKRIALAIFTFTEKDIAQALIEAYARGVIIEIVADRGYGADKFSRIPQLANYKIPIWIYQTSDDERQSSLMHDKFCIFEDNFL